MPGTSCDRRKRGRPAKPEDRRRTVGLRLYVEPHEADSLYHLARLLDRPLSDLLRDHARLLLATLATTTSSSAASR